MAASDIEWTDATWNPVAGCTLVSPGCTNCYAMRMAARLGAMGQLKYRGTTRRSGGRAVWTGQINLDPRTLRAPLGWRPLRIFVNSMSDLFHDAVPVDFIHRVWEIMRQANWHTYQILTKRPQRMRMLVATGRLEVLPHVWLGTSVESAEYTFRIDELRGTPASVRFVSFEPLLSPVGAIDLQAIDWAIVGGESGPNARPMERAWVDEIRRACFEQEVAFFFKQWGGTNKKKTGRQLDGRTWDELPVGGMHTHETTRSCVDL
jgi:protein gp37